MKKALAYANANIALIKYWGKSEPSLNIPAVPSLSMTLDGLGTTVAISPSPANKNVLKINGATAESEALVRTLAFLEHFQHRFGMQEFLSIESWSSVPYAAGLASSASYFASLSLALNKYFGLGLTQTSLADLARIGSASAARSVFGGFVGLIPASDKCDTMPLFVSNDLDLAMVIAVCDDRKKKISSRQAMQLTQNTSPYFAAFVAESRADFAEGKAALEAGSLSRLGQVMESSTLKMHAAMWAAKPPINYLYPKSLAIMNMVYDLRATTGIDAYFTMDAGPNVKILCNKSDSASIARKLELDLSIDKVYICQPGQSAHLISEELA